MTKGTKFFRIIISVLLGLTMLCSAFFAAFFCLFFLKDPYGIYVAGVSVNRGNQDDILGECIRVSGLMEVGVGSAVNASAKNTHAIACFGAVEANEGAAISAVSENNDADIFCSGAVVNRGAEVDGEMDALGGIHILCEAS